MKMIFHFKKKEQRTLIDLETEINPTLGVDSNNKPNKCEKCNKPLFNKNSFDWTSKRSSRQVETL